MNQKRKELNILLKHVRVHNLKDISIELPRNSLICFTGVSGSGKSSLAFDTLYVEGQRRYVESLSQHARRFLGDLPKPDIDSADGISPTISIEQKSAGKNPRSTVGTITEIYDYFRVLFARAGIAHCPVSHEPVKPRSKEEIISEIQAFPSGKRIILMAPHVRGKKGDLKDDFEAISKKGYTRARLDGNFIMLSDEVMLDKSTTHDLDVVIDRLETGEKYASRIAESTLQALEFGQGVLIIYDPDSQEEKLFSTLAYSPKSGLSYPPLDPQDFSFNSPSGMCPECQGMGMKHEFDISKIIDSSKSIAEDACMLASSYETVRYGNIYDNLARLYNFDVHTPWKKLSDKAKKIYLYGTEKKWTRMYFVHPVTGASWYDTVQWRGVLHEAYSRYQEAKSEKYKKRMEAYMHFGICNVCKGSRLRDYPSAATFAGKTIQELCHLTIEDCLTFLKNVELTSQEKLIAEELIKEIVERLTFLKNVGLDYIQLDRTAPTLSGGESQRVRLASQIGSGLVGVTYVLDEPSIGLHPQDNKKLITSLKHLKEKGNTVVVVEHDEETIRSCDHIVDFGPKAGINGGTIVYEGDYAGLIACKNSLTGSYLSHRQSIAIPEKRRKHTGKEIIVRGATQNNLKNVEAKLPLGCFIAVTGVSGSGKSSLFLETVYPAISNAIMKSEIPCGPYTDIIGLENIDKIIEIDQSPIGRTPRSNPGTYIKVFDDIRDLFSKLPESQTRGYKPGRFSFNVKEGSCVECKGMGMVKVEMDFLEDSWIECPSCKGKRFDHETLQVRFKERSIQDILEMDAKEAKELFAHIPHIHHKLSTLCQVGLDYIKLGQSSTTLSGGEAQRMKLAKELTRPDTGKTLYILDEPTTGLHFHDIKHLLEVLHALVEKGNTVVVIEHNMDLVKTADWVIEMGPGSGQAGGTIIAEGTPEEIAHLSVPTAEAIKEALEHQRLSHTKKLKPRQKKRQSQVEVIAPSIDTIEVKKAEQNNLKKITCSIPHNQITVCTGPSGSGKSSFAFETVFAEGQRRYVESLSPYVRQFVKQMPKPRVEEVQGLCPTVAIEQRTHANNPRSTIGTMTEIYDFLRILWSRIGTAHCPKTGKEIRAISKEHVVERILSYPQGERIIITAPLEIKRTENFAHVLHRLQGQGYMRVRINGTYHELADAEKITYDPKKKNEVLLVVDRFKQDPSLKHRMYEAISLASDVGKGKVIVQREDTDIFFNLAFAVEETGESYPEITPKTFAFNTPQGMCPDCLGLGFQWGVDFTALPFVHNLSPRAIVRLLSQGRLTSELTDAVISVLEESGISVDEPLSHCSSKELQIFMKGTTKKYEIQRGNLRFSVSWRGINTILEDIAKHSSEYTEDGVPPLPEEWRQALKEIACPTCHGSRITELARHVTVQGKSIFDATSMSLADAQSFIKQITIDPKDLALVHVHEELILRLQFLIDIGLSYLSLSRAASTLSGGEAQRVRLGRQIGSGLTGVLYVLDEPTIGLHPKDSELLLDALNRLKTLGNSLLVVEHDPQFIYKADHIIEFGPRSGKEGGTIVAKGSIQDILHNPASTTAQYLEGKYSEFVFGKKKKKVDSTPIRIKKATIHNLKNASVEIPTGQLVAISGVSGSGKSTLVQDVIEVCARKLQQFRRGNVTLPFDVTGLEQFKNLIVIDQKPIGTTLRSDVTTYMDILTPIRHFFASLPDAQIKGLQPKNFSTYHRKGMCTACWGLGYKKVEMHFLPPVKIACPQCHGLRLNPVSLSITYKDKNLGQILQLTVKEAHELFINHPKIKKLLDMMISVGLDYLILGQEIQTLSSGESQRMKLSKELVKRAQTPTLYLLDEPTSGLHGSETEKLLAILQELVNKGHTIIAIEHNLDFIAACDHVIDLGPGPGIHGGKVIAQGHPLELMKMQSSVTGKYLQERFPHITKH